MNAIELLILGAIMVRIVGYICIASLIKQYLKRNNTFMDIKRLSKSLSWKIRDMYGVMSPSRDNLELYKGAYNEVSQIIQLTDDYDTF